MLFRHREEREKQQLALNADANAASWKQALGHPLREPSPHQALECSAPESHAEEAVEAGPKSEEKNNVASVQAGGDTHLDQGGTEVAAVENGVAREKGREPERGDSFVCSVVPLSLALEQLQVARVDLLKVDVEGDELAVLHGIEDEDWPMIRQVRNVNRWRMPQQQALDGLEPKVKRNDAIFQPVVFALLAASGSPRGARCRRAAGGGN